MQAKHSSDSNSSRSNGAVYELESGGVLKNNAAVYEFAQSEHFTVVEYTHVQHSPNITHSSRTLSLLALTPAVATMHPAKRNKPLL
jgi:hypothetical protein